jgi:hypothetical protein
MILDRAVGGEKHPRKVRGIEESAVEPPLGEEAGLGLVALLLN